MGKWVERKEGKREKKRKGGFFFIFVPTFPSALLKGGWRKGRERKGELGWQISV